MFDYQTSNRVEIEQTRKPTPGSTSPPRAGFFMPAIWPPVRHSEPLSSPATITRE